MNLLFVLKTKKTVEMIGLNHSWLLIQYWFKKYAEESRTTSTKFLQCKGLFQWSVAWTPAPQKRIGLTVSLRLCLNLYSCRWLISYRRCISNFKLIESDVRNVNFSLTFINLVKYVLNFQKQSASLKLLFDLFHWLKQ